ncbi:glycosyltransferase family 2 protein [Paracoccus panacisoli]|uniref:Glycosyltransferase family 2 protein n=1 Tax=Paracoccus panacisoli TaxID=1510163 RepID=A0ABV6T6Y7_9RHOB
MAPVQRAREVLLDAAGREFPFYIDAVRRMDGRLVVFGWCTADNLDVEIAQAGTIWPAAVQRHGRSDVAEALGLPPTKPFGFAVISDAPVNGDPIELGLCIANGPRQLTGPLQEAPELTEFQELIIRHMEGGRKKGALGLVPLGSPLWRKLLGDFDYSQAAPDKHLAHIEGVILSPEGGGIVFGWALHAPDAIIWFEDGLGNIHPMSAAFRRERRDIRDGFPDNPWSDQDSAFVAYLPELDENSTVAIRVVTEDGISTLSEHIGGERLPSDPRQAADKLFSIETEDRLFHRRAGIVDWPVLAPLIRRRMEEASGLQSRRKDFGKPPKAPEVSVIVPLYRRFDFMEHQLLEFGRDPEFRRFCEVIYVIDDPLIEADVLAGAEYLHRLLDLPFTVISGRRNRGFSGANNLGAEYARGRLLLFLNSDVIPQGPGWLGPMRATLDTDQTIGVVGPRLLFANGGLQHAGMSFEKLNTLGIWINRHPNAGLGPEFDPAQAPAEVPAVTGACMLITRKVFDEIGGWDTGYLIGDFEDSDLCLTLRKRGYRVIYHPDVQLTHLERQSFSAIGHDHFKLRVTITNAVRHQERWEDMLAASAAAPVPSHSRKEMTA